MADKTFRQAVLQILVDGIKANEPVQVTLDKVCAEVSKLAEGMPHGDFKGDDPVERMRLKCQAYLRKQVKE